MIMGYQNAGFFNSGSIRAQKAACTRTRPIVRLARFCCPEQRHYKEHRQDGMHRHSGP